MCPPPSTDRGLFFKTQRNLAIFFVDFKHLELFAFVQLEDFLWIGALTLTEFTDVNKGFDGWADLNESTKRRDTGHRTFDACALLELINLFHPRIFLELFEAEAQAVFIDSDDLRFDIVANLDVVARVIDALPANLTDVDQALDTFDVNECTEVYNTGYDTANSVTDLELLKAVSETFFDGFLLREDELVCLAVCIEDANLDRLANQAIEALEDFVLITRAHTWIVLS